MKLIKYTLILWTLCTISAYTSVTVIPQTGDMFTVIANGNSETKAAKTATDKAGRICELQSQSLKILDSETAYQGVNTDQQKLIKLAKDILPSGKTAGAYTPSDYDYKSTLTFRCI